MTAHKNNFDDLDPRIAQWLAQRSSADALADLQWDGLAEWVDAPCENADVESLLCHDAEARKAAIEIRLGQLASAEEIDPALRNQLYRLNRFEPAIAGRIGNWSVAAAAAVLLALCGYWLGSLAPTSAVDQDTLVASVLGFDANSPDAPFYDFTSGLAETSTP